MGLLILSTEEMLADLIPGLFPAPRRFAAGYDSPQRESGPHGFLMAILHDLMGVPLVKVADQNLLDNDVGGGCSHVIFWNAP